MNGSIECYVDRNWLTPLISLPGSNRWDDIDTHLIKRGLIAELSGQSMMYLDVANHWIPLGSREAAVRVSQLVGNDNVSVNYITAYLPYYSRLKKACALNSFKHVPLSTCIGTRRLAIEYNANDRSLAFHECAPYDVQSDRPDTPDIVYDLCYKPTAHVSIPMTFRYPGMGTVMNFLRPLFPNCQDLVTYMWIIGNCARDPVARPRCMLLCGPGGSGKSTALRMASGAMQGACEDIPNGLLSSRSPSSEQAVGQAVLSSRLVTCSELDLDNGTVNMSLMKNITGADYVKVGEFSARAICSMAVATNGVPDVDRQPEFTSDALTRRIVCIKMDVDTAKVAYEADPTTDIDKVDFHCCCLYMRMKYNDLPISTDSLLLTICMSRYFVARRYVRDCTNEVQDTEASSKVIPILAGIMGCDQQRIIDRCNLVSCTVVMHTSYGYVIKGMTVSCDTHL